METYELPSIQRAAPGSLSTARSGRTREPGAGGLSPTGSPVAGRMAGARRRGDCPSLTWDSSFPSSRTAIASRGLKFLRQISKFRRSVVVELHDGEGIFGEALRGSSDVARVAAGAPGACSPLKFAPCALPPRRPAPAWCSTCRRRSNTRHSCWTLPAAWCSTCSAPRSSQRLGRPKASVTAMRSGKLPNNGLRLVFEVQGPVTIQTSTPSLPAMPGIV